MHVGVYGSGYLATVISACIADFGVPVTCVDEDQAAIGAMAQGQSAYYEKNLPEIVRRNVRAGRLTYSSEITSLTRNKPLVFLAQDSAAYIEETAVRIARSGFDPMVMVVATPVPVGTARRIETRVRTAGSHVTVVAQPLFLTDGCAVEDFNWPDRIVLGAENAEAVSLIKQLYRPLVMRGVPVIVTSHETAELVREATTAFVATKLSFINELSALCEHVNADAMHLALALGLDKKVSPRCLQPGSAVGGAFAEAQLDSLSQLAYSRGVSLKILSAAREVNQRVTDRVIAKISGAFESLSGKQVAMLGLAFKPNTHSVAASASIVLARRLVERGVRVNTYDPAAMSEAKAELHSAVHYCESAYTAAEGSDALIFSTGWPEFRALDFHRLKRAVRRPLIIDPKNMLDAVRLKALGFEYVGMGRGQAA
jgi:UDPglucose 6-dehydrogenase